MKYKIEHKKRYKIFIPNSTSQYLEYMVKHESSHKENKYFIR